MKILSSYRSSLVLSFKKYNQFCCFLFFLSHGHPMDLFLKIPVLQENVSWLGDVEERICLWKESVAVKRRIQGV